MQGSDGKTPVQVHGTTVAINGMGVLLRGPSGSGKSDLALRLIEEGARLVADDRTVLRVAGGRVRASAPESILGLLEVRGVGLMNLETAGEVPLELAVDLVPPAQVPRLPAPSFADDLPLAIPRIALAPFEASAPIKVRAALRAAAEDDRRPVGQRRAGP